ncbi:MAG TPA: hypothetical protein VI757_02875 [Bacteroidia bacterium]|nr:hypothetical protein [Bacteroidia bacterium]
MKTKIVRQGIKKHPDCYRDAFCDWKILRLGSMGEMGMSLHRFVTNALYFNDGQHCSAKDKNRFSPSAHRFSPSA